MISGKWNALSPSLNRNTDKILVQFWQIMNLHSLKNDDWSKIKIPNSFQKMGFTNIVFLIFGVVFMISGKWNALRHHSYRNTDKIWCNSDK